MPLPAGVELVNPNVRRGPFRAAVFDFDGTLSLIREGWPEIMVDRMLGHLREQNLVREPEVECAAHLRGFVMALNGHPTIKQMERFAEEVRVRGGAPAAPDEYLRDYLDALALTVRARWIGLQVGASRAEEWVVPHAHAALARLLELGLQPVVASGTDLAHVAHEVELLKLAPFVAGRVFAPKDNDANFRKRDVIARTLETSGVPGTELLGFGDGVVETEEVKRAGGVAVGVASAPAGSRGVHAGKRETLIAAGADLIVPDYEHAPALVAWLWGEP